MTASKMTKRDFDKLMSIDPTLRTREYEVAPGVKASLCEDCVLRVLVGVRPGTHVDHETYVREHRGHVL